MGSFNSFKAEFRQLNPTSDVDGFSISDLIDL